MRDRKLEPIKDSVIRHLRENPEETVRKTCKWIGNIFNMTVTEKTLSTTIREWLIEITAEIKENENKAMSISAYGRNLPTIKNRSEAISMSIISIYEDLLGYWKKCKTKLESEDEQDKLGIEARVRLLTMIQAQLIKATELEAKINGTIQTGNKQTFNFGAEDLETRKRDKRLMEFINERYLMAICGTSLSKVMLEFTDYEKRHKKGLEEEWQDVEVIDKDKDKEQGD